MANVFTLAADRFLGRGEASVAIPPMDGALKPNSAVDKADHLLAIARPDNLLRADNSVLFSSGRQLLAVVSEREQSLRMQGVGHVNALPPVGLDGEVHNVSGLRQHPHSVEHIRQRGADPLGYI